MKTRSGKRNKTLLSVLAAITIGILLFATALAVGEAGKEKSEYISASQRLALHDLADAALQLEEAVKAGDVAAMNRAAGKAEAYLSRSGIRNCGDVYSIINGICTGEYDAEMSERLSLAVTSALEGDGGDALRSLCREEETEEISEETTEDLLSSRVLKRIGRGGDDVAAKRAAAFACPNAVFEECDSGSASSYKYSGDNIFIAVEGESARVTMYCFDRDRDDRYSVTKEEAEHTVEMIVKKEKLKLPHKAQPILDGDVYRFVYKDEEADDGDPLLIFEIYADTGRLRKYDAVNYYHFGK